MGDVKPKSVEEKEELLKFCASGFAFKNHYAIRSISTKLWVDLCVFYARTVDERPEVRPEDVLTVYVNRVFYLNSTSACSINENLITELRNNRTVTCCSLDTLGGILKKKDAAFDYYVALGRNALDVKW
ncbi:unnamed protein product [Bursaphelenchus okinawaensis]|uniref:Uncharacterized protein n=1 Tax=Bursaphelenchus okinawaensis TaxID=465554 RepID=A0A811LR15_9BILA|nr:unnamed protein product [Bursaphelenchus okinawaensis]CAG9127278.1 unnamed protein product [Bursaphelenchus okinawaensis]